MGHAEELAELAMLLPRRLERAVEEVTFFLRQTLVRVAVQIAPQELHDVFIVGEGLRRDTLALVVEKRIQDVVDVRVCGPMRRFTFSPTGTS